MASPVPVLVPDWAKEIPASITVCDSKGIITYLNDTAAKGFEKWGGNSLIGKNLMDCHNPGSRDKIKQILETGIPNIYTTEKSTGEKKFSPHYENGLIKGLVEIVVVLPPGQIPNFKRS